MKYFATIFGLVILLGISPAEAKKRRGSVPERATSFEKVSEKKLVVLASKFIGKGVEMEFKYSSSMIAIPKPSNCGGNSLVRVNTGTDLKIRFDLSQEAYEDTIDVNSGDTVILRGDVRKNSNTLKGLGEIIYCVYSIEKIGSAPPMENPFK